MKDAHGPSTDALPPWLSRTKVRPPQQRLHIVRRPALEARLNEGMQRPATLLSAPAGYGKSTLLATWLETLEKDGCKRCWLTLDADDNSDWQLQAYLALALFEGGAVPASLVQHAVGQTDSPRQLINRLINAIEELSMDTVLVLDELEHLAPPVLSAVIHPLLATAPGNLHVFMATRDASALDLSRLQAAGGAGAIDARALHFTPEETRGLIGEALSDAELSEAVSRTAGWVVAVQLLRTALEHDRDTVRQLQALATERHAMGDFLSRQVVEALPGHLRSFLEDVSIMNQVSCAEADYLRNSDNARQCFNELRALQALLRPLDATDDAFVLHPLLREHLRQRLRATRASSHQSLQARAARWRADRGDLVGAVRHALEGDNPLLAAELILDLGGISLWLREGITRIRSAMQLLGKPLINNNARLLLLQCIIDIKEGRVFEAGMNCRRAETLAGAGADELLQEELALVDAYHAIYAGKRVRDSSYRHVLESTSRLRGFDYDRYAFHCTSLCVMNTQSGNFPSARRFAEEAIRTFREMGSLYGETYIYFHTGDISFAAGDSAAAEANYRHGLDLAKRHFREDKGLRLVGHTMLIELLDELGREDYSEAVLRALPRELEAREAWFEIYAAGYCTASNIELRSGGIAAALRILDRAERYAERQQLTHLRNLLLCQRIELLVLAGQARRARMLVQRARFTLSSYAPDAEHGAAWRETAAAALALGKLLLAEGQAEAAIGAVSGQVVEARRLGHTRSLIRYTLLESLARWSLGQQAAAMERLGEALDAARQSGFIRAMLDAGPELDELLGAAAAVSTDTEQAAFLDKLSRLRRREAPDGFSGHCELSGREQAILQEVASGRSNKQVARALSISENTVRFHLKNIFLKLRVHNRAEAVSQAHSRKLLEPGLEAGEGSSFATGRQVPRN
jgi:LuxR family maltose regulon positive regulatory protein